MSNLFQNDSNDQASTVRSRVVGSARATLVIVGLLAAWAIALFLGWDMGSFSGEEGSLRTELFAAIAILLALTVVWIASLRSGRLRRALLPWEVGLLVGVIVLAAGHSLSPHYLENDGPLHAVEAGITAALLVAFMSVLLGERRTAPLWILGVAVVAIVLGVSIPEARYRLSSRNDTLLAPGGDNYGTELALSVVTPDGYVRLGGIGFSGASDVQYSESANARKAPIGSEPAIAAAQSGPISVAQGVEPASGSVGTIDPATGAATVMQAPLLDGAEIPVLLADASGKLQLRVPAEFVDASSRARVVVTRGDCADGVGRQSIWSGSMAGGRVLRTAITGTRLSDIQIYDRIRVLIGSGVPLAPVRCTNLAAPLYVALARNGATAFARQCRKPLRDASTEWRQLTPASFQDPDCARKLTALGRLAVSDFIVGPMPHDVRRCLKPTGSRSEVRALAGGDTALYIDVAPGEDAAVSQCVAKLPAPDDASDASPSVLR